MGQQASKGEFVSDDGDTTTFVPDKYFTLMITGKNDSTLYYACDVTINNIKYMSVLRKDQVVPNEKGLITQYKFEKAGNDINGQPNPNAYYITNQDGERISDGLPPWFSYNSSMPLPFIVSGMGTSQISVSIANVDLVWAQKIGTNYNILQFGIPSAQNVVGSITCSSQLYATPILHYNIPFYLNVVNYQGSSSNYYVSANGDTNLFAKQISTELTLACATRGLCCQQFYLQRPYMTNDKTGVKTVDLKSNAANPVFIIRAKGNSSDISGSVNNYDGYLLDASLGGDAHWYVQLQKVDDENNLPLSLHTYQAFTDIDGNYQYYQMCQTFSMTYVHSGDYIGSQNGPFTFTDPGKGVYVFRMVQEDGSAYQIDLLNNLIVSGLAHPSLIPTCDACPDPRFPFTCDDGKPPTITSDGKVTCSTMYKALASDMFNGCCGQTLPYNCPKTIVSGALYAFYSPGQQKWLQYNDYVPEGVFLADNDQASFTDGYYILFALTQDGVSAGDPVSADAPIYISTTNTDFPWKIQLIPSVKTGIVLANDTFTVNIPKQAKMQYPVNVTDLKIYEQGTDPSILHIPQVVSKCNVCDNVTCESVMGSSFCKGNRCQGKCQGAAQCTVDPKTLKPTFTCSTCSDNTCPNPEWQQCDPTASKCCIPQPGRCDPDETDPKYMCPDGSYCDKNTHKCQTSGGGGNNGKRDYTRIAITLAMLVLFLIILYQIRSVYKTYMYNE